MEEGMTTRCHWPALWRLLQILLPAPVAQLMPCCLSVACHHRSDSWVDRKQAGARLPDKHRARDERWAQWP